MCRSADNHSLDLPKIRAFFVRLRLSASGFNANPLPQSLTLLFLPSTHSILALHRLPTPNTNYPYVIFGGRPSLRAAQPLCFQLYFRQAKFLKGFFIQDDHHNGKLECRWQIQNHSDEISEAEVCVVLEDGHMATAMLEKEKKKLPMMNGWELGQIPEETELDYNDADTNSPVNGSDAESNNPDSEECMDMDLERVRCAVDWGIWVLCLGVGVGYLVSKASVRKFRRLLRPIDFC